MTIDRLDRRIVRRERPEDERSIRIVLEQAFGQAREADLVEALRRRGAFALSLVATEKKELVGYTLFTPVTIEPHGGGLNAIGLGPMGVLTTHQRRGIGSRLGCSGIDRCRRAGHEIMVVLGHPGFYPKFGFTHAKTHGVRFEFDVPDDVFMVLELREGALGGAKGIVKYQPEFGSL